MTIATPPPEEFNFARHLLQLNEARPQSLAFIDDDTEISYGELFDRVKRIGSAFLERGLSRGERVMLVMPDRIEWPLVFLGAIYAGLVPVAVNTLLTLADYVYLLDHSNAAAVIATNDLLPKLLNARSELGKGAARLMVVVGSHETPHHLDQVMSLESLLANGDSDYKGASTCKSDVAFWLYSSGSTGRPKGVLHSHANLYWTAELYGKPVMGISESDRVFSAAKLFFAYGLGNALTFPLSVGGAAILMAERPTPAAVLKRLHQHEATIFCGAPTLYASLLTTEPSARPSKLRLCTSAGEALPKEVGDRFVKQYGVDILDGLGSTEMLHIFVSNRVPDLCYGTTGLPVAGYDVELRGEQGEILSGCGQIGDLWVRGPSAALHYWNDEAKTRNTFHEGWVRTGDKYVRRDDGRLVYAGRNDDMLKISGQFVSPFEVESTLLQHPCVLECAVIAVVDQVGISKSKAFVVLRPGHEASTVTADDLKAFVKSRLAPFKRPHYVEFVLELPKTATGKIQRYLLREKARDMPRAPYDYGS
jgi:benzoate-CoA ligase